MENSIGRRRRGDPGVHSGERYLVEAPPSALAKIGTIPAVAWIGEYLPAYKMSRSVREWQRGGGTEVRECDVRLVDSRDRAHLVREFGEMPGASVSRSGNLGIRARLRVWLSPKQAEEACARSEVEGIDLHVKPRLWVAAMRRWKFRTGRR